MRIKIPAKILAAHVTYAHVLEVIANYGPKCDAATLKNLKDGLSVALLADALGDEAMIEDLK